MPLIRKDVLWCGRWTYPDGRVLDIGPEGVRNAGRQGKRMLANGLGVPLVWEHQPDAVPRRAVEMSAAVYGDPAKRAAWARNVIAPVAGYEVRESRRGPVLFALVDDAGLTAAEKRQLSRAGKVSCRLDRNFRDLRGGGTLYPGLVVSHVAVTPKPVEPNQGPFLMSADWPADETFYLGMAAMADTAPADADLADLDELNADAPGGGAAAGGGPTGDLAALIAALRDKGFTIPDEVLDMKHLVIAVKASPAPGSTGGGGDGGAVPGGQPPVLMSQAQMAERYPARVANDREEAAAEIGLLVRRGQVPPDTGKDLRGRLDAFEMSYADGALVRADVLADIAAYKKLPRGLFLAKRQPAGFDMSHTRPVDRPAGLDGRPESPDELAKKQRDATTALVAGGR